MYVMICHSVLMFKTVLAFIVSALALCGTAQASDWSLVPDDSHIKFSAAQSGEGFTGTFTDFTADITFDPDDLENARVVAEIDMRNFDTGSQDRNSSLPGKDWFYVKKFMTATFSSEDFMQKDDGTYEASGTLELRGVTQAVILPFTLSIAGDRAVMEGQVSLNRSDFGVGQGAWASGEWVSLNVDIDVKVTATR